MPDFTDVDSYFDVDSQWTDGPEPPVRTIAEQGSLILKFYRDGWTANYIVEDRNTGKRGVLSHAAAWFDLDGQKLNGSQVQTVKKWFEEYE